MKQTEGRVHPVWAFSLGELLFTVALLGVLAGLALREFPKIMASAAATEPFSMAVTTRVNWSEHWAVHGDWPQAPVTTIVVARPVAHRVAGTINDGTYTAQSDAAGNGSVTFTFNAKLSHIEGRLLTLRPAFSAGEFPDTLLWVCGQAAIPRGFRVVGHDLTDLSGDDLPSACRRRS